MGGQISDFYADTFRIDPGGNQLNEKLNQLSRCSWVTISQLYHLCFKSLSALGGYFVQFVWGHIFVIQSLEVVSILEVENVLVLW